MRPSRAQLFTREWTLEGYGLVGPSPQRDLIVGVAPSRRPRHPSAELFADISG
jgi:hypothetical protein